MDPRTLGIEDDPSDILRKAQRGTGLDPQTLAHRSGIAAARIAAWTAGDGVPSESEARSLAELLGLDPGRFADRVVRGYHPETGLPPDVRHHPHDPHPSNGYLFHLAGARTAALIDPAGLPRTILDAIAEGPFALRYILITHRHADHCDATADVVRAFPDAQIVMHRHDVDAIGELAGRALILDDGETLPFGEAASIQSIHTPGHTDGSVSYLFRGSLFSGDTLFAGSVGGIFGERYGYGDLLDAVRTRLFTLPGETVVMPGHGPPTTIAHEKAHNPFFRGID